MCLNNCDGESSNEVHGDSPDDLHWLGKTDLRNGYAKHIDVGCSCLTPSISISLQSISGSQVYF